MQQTINLFSEADRARINAVIATAESQTSAEIVPAVATASGRYDRPEDIVGLWTALLALALTWWWMPRASDEPGHWGGPSPGLELVLLLLSVVVGFVIGSVVASRVYWLRGLFTPERQKQDEVWNRARQIFFDSRVHHTGGRTGMLIYLSLFERRAAVVADQKVIDGLGHAAITKLCAQLTRDLKTRPPADALCDALQQAGRQLSAVLPRQADDVNELPDALVLLD